MIIGVSSVSGLIRGDARAWPESVKCAVPECRPRSGRRSADRSLRRPDISAHQVDQMLECRALFPCGSGLGRDAVADPRGLVEKVPKPGAPGALRASRMH